MSGICGWVSQNPAKFNKNEINLMAHKLPEGGTEKQIVTSDTSQISACTRRAGNAGEFANGIFVAVDGSDLYWSNDVINKTLQEQGVAESVAQAYKKYGESFINYLHGTFSLCLYSAKDDLLLLAIDRLGVKPLCYHIQENQYCIFASNLSSITQHSLVTKSLSAQAIYNYVYFHFIPSPQTVFNNIFKLEPAQYLIYKNGRATLKKYWYPDFSNRANDIDKLAVELNKELGLSISKYKSTDNTGTFLSGGLDSSTVTGIFASVSENPVNSYSIGFDAEGFDEIEYARIAARKFNTKAIEYYVTPEDIVTALPVVAKAYDEPFGNSSAIPAYFCSRLARSNGTRVLLAGDGGDELFAGNERYTKQLLLQHYGSIPAVLRSYFLEPVFTGFSAIKYIPVLKKIRRYIEQAQLSIIDRMGDETYRHLQGFAPEEIFSGKMLASIDTDYPIKLLDHTYNEVESESFMDNMLYLDWKFTLADNDLRKVNRMCEINGIDVRYPMLDENVVNFSCRVPSRLKITETKLRHFYKYATSELLPEEIINKPKHGFGLPFGVWLKTVPELQQFAYDSLDALKARNIVQKDFINRLIETHRKGHASYFGSMIWALTMLEQWLREHDIQGQII